MMESVDKLRVFCDKLRNVDDNHVSAEYVAERCAIDVRRMADEIEREIAERYMELPLDVDGVPIRVGDTLEYVYEDIRFVRKVVAVSSDMFAWESVGSDSDFGIRGIAKFHHHIDPRTVEDVLADFAAEVEQGRNTIETARRYADELRGMMEVE